MKNFKHTLIALVAVFAAGAASAQSAIKGSDYYGEAGYLSLKFTDNSSVSPTPTLARFVVGKDINENLSVEGIAGLTVSKGSWSSSNKTGEVSGSTYGVYAKPKMAIAQGTEIFARVGVANTSWKSEISTGQSTDDSATKLAYGVGVQAQFTKTVHGQIDYMMYGKANGWDAKGFTLSVGTRF